MFSKLYFFRILKNKLTMMYIKPAKAPNLRYLIRSLPSSTFSKFILGLTGKIKLKYR
jgi:hypothetical protein